MRHGTQRILASHGVARMITQFGKARSDSKATRRGCGNRSSYADRSPGNATVAHRVSMPIGGCE
jgi:hypothetical protein